MSETVSPVATTEPVTAESSIASVSAARADLPVASWVTVMEPPPPLMQYANGMNGPGEDPGHQAAQTQWNANWQKFVSDCMLAQGFTWVPRPSHTAASTTPQVSLALGVLPVPRLSGDREVVAREGYGVMSTPEEQLVAVGGDDPNLVNQQSLSSAERQAYDFALYGDPANPAGSSGASCTGRASAEFPEPSQSEQTVAFLAEFWDLTYAALVSVADDDRLGTFGQDRRVQNLNARWESCMNGKGYVFQKVSYESGPILGMGLAVRTHPDGVVGPVRDGVPSSEIPDDEKSLSGSEPERAVALDDYDCRAQVDFMTQLAQIRVSRDEDFITNNHDALDRLIAAAEAW
ncbi:MAG: hypothetical protein LBV06_09910 [Propionibacteriaceae bacterium]|jgi:hypothetical protein|nr:hypothetical protein [Propionibacteriaceae bacterium]